jgi:hypothetical protein
MACSMDFNPPAFTGLPIDVKFLVMLLFDLLDWPVSEVGYVQSTSISEEKGAN